MLARSPKQTWMYVLEEDRHLPREKQTIWRLQHLSIAQEHALVDQLERDPITGKLSRRQLGTEHLRTLRSNLTGWSNFRSIDGTEIPFESDVFGGAKEELLYRIRLGAREELARAIEDESEYDPDEVGKSSPPAESGTAGS